MSTISATPTFVNTTPTTGIPALTQQVASELASLPIQLPAGALNNASPGDLVKLSNAALQYQEASTLFGDPASSTSGTTNASASLESLLSTIGTPADQAGNATAQTQLQNEATLLGLPSLTSATTTDPTQPLIQLLGGGTGVPNASTDPFQTILNGSNVNLLG